MSLLLAEPSFTQFDLEVGTEPEPVGFSWPGEPFLTSTVFAVRAEPTAEVLEATPADSGWREWSPTAVVSWYGLDSPERYESDQAFVERLGQSVESSRYAARLLTLLHEQDPDFLPVEVSAIRRAWDVVAQLPPGGPTARIFRGEGGSVDVQVREPGQVRLLTAGTDGVFESHLLDKRTGTITRRIHFGPSSGLHFLLTGGAE